MRNRTKITILAVLALLVVSVVAAIQPVFACEPPYCCPGTGTPGYWMNHPEAWPVEEICIGISEKPECTFSMCLTKAQAIAMMMEPVAGDKRLTMFPALVAAKLNLLMGCGCACHEPVCDPESNPYYQVGRAQAWFACHGDTVVTADSDAWQYSDGESIYEWLDEYNNGELCAPSRDLLEDMCE